MKADSVLTRHIVFPYSAIDARHRPRIPLLLHFFQDLAAEHAACLNISGLDLGKKNYKWVISKYHIRISGKISWMDQLTIKTWRTPFKNLYDMRQFEIQDHNDTVLVSATGVWIMINKNTLKPVRLDRFMTGKLLESPDPNLDFRLPEIKYSGPADIEKCFDIEYQNIDLNQHVNNTVYLNWALETVPVEMMTDYFPTQIDMSFHRESYHGQKILSQLKISDQGSSRISSHRILENENQTVLSMVNIKWAPQTTP